MTEHYPGLTSIPLNDTPNVRMYDRALSWLDIDTPNVRMYDRALS